MFERRMRERFFSCIDALIAADTRLGAASAESPNTNHCTPGFSIMALCCLLCDSLQSFREEEAPITPQAGPCPFPSGACIKTTPSTNQQFRSFLSRPAFGDTFKDKTIANGFTNGIRNGILHDCETRRWVIWRDRPEGKIIAREGEGDGYAVNRELFYAAVQQEFESYLVELRDPANQALRNRFEEKMNDIVKDKRRR